MNPSDVKVLPNKVGAMAPKAKRQRLATKVQEAAAIAGCTGNQTIRLGDEFSAQTFIDKRNKYLEWTKNGAAVTPRGQCSDFNSRSTVCVEQGLWQHHHSVGVFRYHRCKWRAKAPFCISISSSGSIERASQVGTCFLFQYLQGTKLEIIVYMDECRLGNVLRPDKGRGLHDICWTIKQLPDWFRQRYSYFHVAYCPSNVVSGHDVSPLFCKIMQTFFSSTGGGNFRVDGVTLLYNGKRYTMKAEMGFVIVDGKAIGELASAKGLNARVMHPF